MRYRLILILWIAGILFPIAALGRLSDSASRVLDRLFGPEWLHIVLHSAIFAGLVILLSFGLARQGRRLSPLMLVLVVLAVGCLQELLQYVTDEDYVQPAIAAGLSAFDLAVDLAGGFLGLAAFNRLRIFQPVRSQARTPASTQPTPPAKP